MAFTEAKRIFYRGVEKVSDVSQKLEIAVAGIALYFGSYGVAALAAIGALIDQAQKDWAHGRNAKLAHA